MFDIVELVSQKLCLDDSRVNGHGESSRNSPRGDLQSIMMSPLQAVATPCPSRAYPLV